MKKVNELNTQVRAAFSDPYVELSRGKLLGISELPENLQSELTVLQREVDQAIPNDFNYTLRLGDYLPSINLAYDNGPQAGGFWPLELDAQHPLVEQLESLDWDKQRGFAVQGSEQWQVMKGLPEHRRLGFIPTKELQKGCRDYMKEWIKERRKITSVIHVMFLSECEDDFMYEEFECMADFIAKLPEMMSVEEHVITVVADGKPMPAHRIDELKAMALSRMPYCDVQELD